MLGGAGHEAEFSPSARFLWFFMSHPRLLMIWGPEKKRDLEAALVYFAPIFLLYQLEIAKWDMFADYFFAAFART